MKILIISSKIQIGGFSKSLIYLVDCLQKYNVEIDLLFTMKSDSTLMKQIPETVNIIENDNDLVNEYRSNEETFSKKIITNILSGRLYYKLKFKLIIFIKYKKKKIPQYLNMKFMQIDAALQVKYLKSECNFYEKYDCVISWEESFCNYLLALKVNAKKKIGYIHPDYIGAQFYKPIDLEILSKLDNIAVISDSCKKSLNQAMPEFASKVITIPNVISTAKIKKFANDSISDMKTDKFTILTVCRLQNSSKALERAIEICANLRKCGLIFRWYVIGDGEDKINLLKLIKENNLDEIFVLLGEKDNPYPYMKKADIFVLQSYYEGRPIVVDEAMILGTPVLVTNYSSARDQVNDKLYGFVVNNDKNEIYSKIKDIIQDPQKLIELRKNLANKNWDDIEDCSKFLESIKN